MYPYTRSHPSTTTTPPLSSLTLLLLLLALSATTRVSATSTQNATCYWPNGDTDTDYIPCPNSKTCCLRGEACLSNGLCYGPKLNIAYRGACTDDSWPISECPRVCYEEIPDQWANLFSCPNSSTNVFTCGYAGWATDVCDTNLGTWLWDSGNVTVGQNGMAGLSTTTTTITTNCSANGSTTTETVMGYTTGGNNLTAFQSESARSSKGISPVALGTALGAGLGVPLLVVSAFLVYFCVRMRRRLHAAGIEGHENPRRVPYRQHSVAEIATQAHNMATELDGFRPSRAELYG
ncbi:hypothetical protein BO70DRAFT_382782 [Aspergillus heteromorphus CBS 117.55]|uniref:Mid2 domain-containing protein n=1 Tax=Aspergillus heteromorphus CBS 117.55 TaxID=1448321 RepID=A0A317V8N6_9EURO|nr:uncharacterized protein BO70DRAFT_382782 [Aspergillus heteromorphus CBS 117.55]PWY68430.1 hypothetical protein BO70DRAFT_382782 [Aspergillus heteromorphus CBS 117.55]